MDHSPSNSTSPPQLVVHEGSNELEHLDLTYLLEEMDLRDALPLLQQLGRRMKPAANNSLLLVDEDTEHVQRPK